MSCIEFEKCWFKISWEPYGALRYVCDDAWWLHGSVICKRLAYAPLFAKSQSVRWRNRTLTEGQGQFSVMPRWRNTRPVLKKNNGLFAKGVCSWFPSGWCCHCKWPIPGECWEQQRFQHQNDDLSIWLDSTSCSAGVVITINADMTNISTVHSLEQQQQNPIPCRLIATNIVQWRKTNNNNNNTATTTRYSYTLTPSWHTRATRNGLDKIHLRLKSVWLSNHINSTTTTCLVANQLK